MLYGVASVVCYFSFYKKVFLKTLFLFWKRQARKQETRTFIL